MAKIGKFAVRDCGVVTLKDVQTGKIITRLDTLKTLNLETTGEMIYSQGGRGNVKLVGFAGDKSASLSLEDALFDLKALALMTGNTAIEGAKDVIKTEILKSNNDTITLSKTPKGDLVGIFRLNADGSLGQELTKGTASPTANEYTITGKVITLNSTTIDGDKFSVFYTVSAANSTTVKVTSDAFPKSFSLEAEVLVVGADQKVYQANLQVPVCKFQETFSLSLSNEGDPSTFSMNIEILKPATSTELWGLVVYDETDIAL